MQTVYSASSVSTIDDISNNPSVLKTGNTKKPSEPLLRQFSSLFEEMSAPDFLVTFMMSCPIAASSKSRFDSWADAFIEHICFEFFNHKGELRSDSPLLFDKYDDYKLLEQKLGFSRFRKYFVICFCEQFVSVSLEADAKLPATFRLFWYDFLGRVGSDFDLEAVLKKRCDREWSRLCDLWSWLQHIAKHVDQSPMRFCRMIECIAYQTHRYLDHFDDFDLDENKLSEIVEAVFNQIGLVRLDDAQAAAIAGLHETFYCLFRKWDTSQFKTLPDYTEYLKNLCFSQSAFISQFFIMGVDFLGRDADENISFFLCDHEPDVRAVKFLESMVDGCFCKKYNVMDEFDLLKNAEDLLALYRKNMSDVFSLLDQVIVAAEFRQLLCFLQDYAGQLTHLNAFFAEHLYLLPEMDKILCSC